MKFIHVLFLSVFALGLPAFGATPLNEEIEQLLKYVSGLKGAAFLRNDTAYSATEAEAHLRQKWKSAGTRIVSAEDFIRDCASKSSLSGRAYLIRFADGHEEPAAQVLQAELRRIREKSIVPR